MWGMVRAGLREGVESRPAFTRASALAYGSALAFAGVGLAAFRLAGFRFAPDIPFVPALWALALALTAPLARRIGWARTADAMELTGLGGMVGMGGFLLIVALTSIAGPFADARLAAMDAALGFHWPAYAHATLRFEPLLRFAYDSFAMQPLLLLPFLALTGRRRAGYEFLVAYQLALLLCGLVYPFAPAIGPDRFFHVVDVPPSPRFDLLIAQIRDGARLIDRSYLTGYVAMPSFHAAAAALLVCAGWRSPLRWPLVGLNLLMLAATPTIGDHYFVDLVAGIAIAAVALAASRRLVAAAEPEAGQSAASGRSLNSPSVSVEA